MIDEQGNPNSDLIAAMTAQNRIDMGLPVTPLQRELAKEFTIIEQNTPASDNPNLLNLCRRHRENFEDESMHVDYAVKEDFSMTETKNLTHQGIIPRNLKNDESEIGWVLDIADETQAFLQITEADDFVLQHFIKYQTVQQLADLFTRAAELLGKRIAQASAEENRIKEIIDSQNLPFEK